MTTQTEALKLALEALQEPLGFTGSREIDAKLKEAITAIKEALAQPEQQNCKDGSCDCCWKEPEQEPVAWHIYFGNEDEPNYVCLGEKPTEKMAVIRPLVFGDITPPQRT